MVMREAKPVQRMPEAKLLGASKGWRSRMAMSAASIADACARYFARPLIPSAIIATLYTEPPPTMNRVFLSRPANAGA